MLWLGFTLDCFKGNLEHLFDGIGECWRELARSGRSWAIVFPVSNWVMIKIGGSDVRQESRKSMRWCCSMTKDGFVVSTRAHDVDFNGRLHLMYSITLGIRGRVNWAQNGSNMWQRHYQKSSSTSPLLELLTTACRVYMSAIWSGDVVSSGSLSSRTLNKRGNRIDMPLHLSTFPIAAVYTGLIDKSAAFTSQTTFASSHTSGMSLSVTL